MACISRRIRGPGLEEASTSQYARITPAAGKPARRGVVATVRERKIDAGLDACPNDFRFAHAQKGGVNAVTSCAFYAGFGCEPGESLKLFQKARPAIRVARIIHGIGPDKNV